MPNLFGETLVFESGVVLVEICPRFDLPGEETSTERCVGDHCDSEVFGCSDYWVCGVVSRMAGDY